MQRCLILLLLLSMAARPAAALSARERIQFADGLYTRGLTELAAAEYNAYLREFSDGAEADTAHFRLGECYRLLGKPVDAQKEFGLVFTRYPASLFRIRAGFKRANILKEDGRFKVAAELFKQVLAERPEPEIEAASLFFMGECLLAQDLKQEAAQAFGDVIAKYKASPFHAYALLKQAEIELASYRDSGDAAALDRALKHLQEAGQVAQTDRVRAEALFQAGEIYFRRGAFKESAAAYRKLIGQFPADQRTAEAGLQAAWAEHNAGLHADALEMTTRALADAGTAGRRDEWLYLKANCERQLTRGKQAVETYAKLIAEFPRGSYTGAARYEKALTSYKLGDYAAVVVEAAGLLEPVELRKNVYWLLAESHAALKQADKAVQNYRLLITEFPDADIAPSATYRLAYQLQSSGNPLEAARYYRDLAARWPGDKLTPQALFAAAACLAQTGAHAEAAKEWTALIDTYPTDGLAEKALYQKAMGELRLQRKAEAAESFMKLLAQYPATDFKADAHYWRGVLLQEGGDLAAAETSLQAALQSNPPPELERETTLALATVLRARGKMAEAAAMFQRLVGSGLEERLPPALLAWLATFNLELGHAAEAAGTAELLIRRNPEAMWQQTGWGILGRVRLAQDDQAAARAAFEKALAAEVATPFAAEAALRLGDIALAAGNAPEASGFYERASSMATAEDMLGVRANAYVGLARAAKAAADPEAAARYYMSVAILYEDPALVPECLYEACLIFRQGGNTNAAAGALKELQTRFPESEWTGKARADGTETKTSPGVDPS